MHDKIHRFFLAAQQRVAVDVQEREQIRLRAGVDGDLVHHPLQGFHQPKILRPAAFLGERAHAARAICLLWSGAIQVLCCRPGDMAKHRH